MGKRLLGGYTEKICIDVKSQLVFAPIPKRTEIASQGKQKVAGVVTSFLVPVASRVTIPRPMHYC